MCGGGVPGHPKSFSIASFSRNPFSAISHFLAKFFRFLLFSGFSSLCICFFLDTQSAPPNSTAHDRFRVAATSIASLCNSMRHLPRDWPNVVVVASMAGLGVSGSETFGLMSVGLFPRLCA